MVRHPEGIAIHGSYGRELVVTPNGKMIFPDGRIKLPMGTQVIPDKQTEEDNDDWMKFDNKVMYFQEFLDENTILRGCINKETLKGKALIYIWDDMKQIDLKTTEIKEIPETLEEQIARIAYDAIERVSE